MSFPRAGDPYPVSPEGHAALARVLSMQFRGDALILACQADAELEAAWVQERESRALVARVHVHPGCRHSCNSGACIVMAGINDPLCIPCQLAEVSDSERHQAARRARARKSA